MAARGCPSIYLEDRLIQELSLLITGCRFEQRMVPVLSLPSLPPFKIRCPTYHCKFASLYHCIIGWRKTIQITLFLQPAGFHSGGCTAPKMRPRSCNDQAPFNPILRNFLFKSFFLPHTSKLVNTPPSKLWGLDIQIQAVPTVLGLIQMLELNPSLSGTLHYGWDSFKYLFCKYLPGFSFVTPQQFENCSMYSNCSHFI